MQIIFKNGNVSVKRGYHVGNKRKYDQCGLKFQGLKGLATHKAKSHK